MKTFILTLTLLFGLLSGAIAQTAVQDLTVTANYHINIVYPKGKMTVSGTFTNNSNSDYKDVVYVVQCVAGDGTVMSSNNYEWFNFIGHGTTGKLKEATYDCPQGCKSVKMGIISATKLQAANQ